MKPRRALPSWVLALAMFLLGSSVRADAPTAARDVVNASETQLHVPAVPRTSVTVRRGTLSISYPPVLESDVRRTVSHAEADAEAVAHRLGMWQLPRFEIRLVPDPDTMRRLAPVEAPPPTYAVGVAYPGLGLALVSSSAPSTWEHSDTRHVLRHEMAHLLLDAATHHAIIPRWFSEGFAIDASGEHDFERFKMLAVASFTGAIVPLRRLDESFSSGPDQVNVAYAESADFVAYLIRSEGQARFDVLVSHLAEGMSFDEAIRQTYRSTLPQFESEWRHDMQLRFLTAPLWAGTGLMWFVGSVLLVMAFLQRRSRSRATLARWDREERAELAPTLNVTVVTPGVRPRSPAESGDSGATSSGGGEPAKQSDVPAIVLDGERYTLH